MNCAICGIRKPKRFCPGVNGNICTICCATGREETVDCPLDCEFLQAAHEHERPPEPDGRTLPDHGVELSDEFLEAHQFLVILLGGAISGGAAQVDGATDYDAREAIGSLITTYKAQQTGLYYESIPTNPYAAEIYASAQSRVAELRKSEADARAGTSTLRDSQILNALIILERLERINNNGRKRSRAFLDILSKFAYGEEAEAAETEENRIIL